MKKSQILILALILIALSAGLFLKSKRERPELASELYTSLEVEFDEQAADRIEIGKGEAPALTLERREGTWRIPSLWNARADWAKVDRLLKALSDLKGDPRSESEELFADYGLTKDAAYTLALFQGGKETVRLAVGDKVPDPDTNFVRKENSAAVFLSDMAVLPAMGIYDNENKEMPQASYWADLDYFRKETAAVTSIEILRQGKEGKEARVKLIRSPVPAPAEAAAPAQKDEAKQKYVWSFEDQEPHLQVDPQEVESLLLTLQNGRATTVADPAQDYGASKRGWTLRLGLEPVKEGEAGETARIDLVSVGEGAAEKFYLKEQGGDTVYELTPYTAAQLTKTLKDFWKDNPFNIDPAQVQGILLKQGDKELFLDGAEDKKAGFEKILEVLANLEYRSTLWNSSLPPGENLLPNRIEVRNLNGQNQIYLAGVIEGESKKAFLLQPEGSALLFSLDEPSFETLSRI